MGIAIEKWSKRSFNNVIGGVREWWKKRKFKLIIDDELLLEAQLPLRRRGSLRRGYIHSILCRQSSFFGCEGEVIPVGNKYSLTSSQSLDSYRDSTDSIVSMDSQDESYTSHITTVSMNDSRLHQQARFFFEHLNFLKSQTQPCEVEIVYKS
jgi:hypothetical protein